MAKATACFVASRALPTTGTEPRHSDFQMDDQLPDWPVPVNRGAADRSGLLASGIRKTFIVYRNKKKIIHAIREKQCVREGIPSGAILKASRFDEEQMGEKRAGPPLTVERQGGSGQERSIPTPVVIKQGESSLQALLTLDQVKRRTRLTGDRLAAIDRWGGEGRSEEVTGRINCSRLHSLGRGCLGRFIIFLAHPKEADSTPSRRPSVPVVFSPRDGHSV